MRRLAFISAGLGLLLVATLYVVFLNSRLPETSPLPTTSPAPTAPQAPTATILAFVVLHTADYGESGQLYRQPEPKLMVITRPEDLIELDDTVWHTAQQKLRELDYSKYFAIAMFQGRQRDDHYGVEIRQVAQEGRAIFIEAQFYVPTPGQELHAIVTSPYQVIAVEKPQDAGRDFEFIVNVAGKAIIKQTNHVP
jgi:hypothetical protein